jgi:hypothetical protein
MYDNENHALAKTDHEADQWINIALWMREHLA